MAVNIRKTKFMLFHAKESAIDDNLCKLFYSDKESSKYDPDIIHEIECYHKNHEDPYKQACK
jgi:hypothetical protein